MDDLSIDSRCHHVTHGPFHYHVLVLPCHVVMVWMMHMLTVMAVNMPIINSSSTLGVNTSFKIVDSQLLQPGRATEVQ